MKRIFFPRRNLPRGWAGGLAGTAVLLLARPFRLPDLVGLTGPMPDGVALAYPWAYDLLGPLTILADRLSLMSLSQWKVLGAWLAAGWLAGRLLAGLRGARGRPVSRPDEIRPKTQRGSLPPAAFFNNLSDRLQAVGIPGWLGEAVLAGRFLVIVTAALAWTAWWGRPMAALRAEGPDLLPVNFHSHTGFSWDGRRNFSPEANMEWHRRAGFLGAFITDHNDPAGSLEAIRKGEGPDGEDPLRPFAGAELGLDGLHMVVLGCGDRPVDPKIYGGYEGIPRAIEAVHRCGGAAVGSLPEYWLYHWGGRFERLADWGMDGFEILNASPKALDFPPAAREEALALCRRRDLPVFAVTDNHGWGSSPPGWNLMRIPGWRGMDRAGLEKEVVRTVRKGGFGAVSVAARPRVEASGGLALALDPPRQAVLALRVLTSRQVLVLLAWLWGCVLLRRPRR